MADYDSLDLGYFVEKINDMFDLAVDMADLFKFMGYNPVDFFNFLKKYAQEKNIPIEEFKDDMIKFVTWVATRGSKVGTDKALGKTGADGKKEIAALKKKWNVIDSVPKTATDVTAARIAGCFPFVHASLIAKGIGKVVSPKGTEFFKDKGVANLPIFLQFPGGPSLIPQQSEDLYGAWREWAAEFQKVITKAKEVTYDNVDQYGPIIWGASLYDSATRKTMMEVLANPGATVTGTKAVSTAIKPPKVPKLAAAAPKGTK